MNNSAWNGIVHDSNRFVQGVPREGKRRMKIVAVTACATGIAHTYMAAERLNKVAKALGHDIKVETQGAMGIENKLSDSEIRNADIVILAIDIEVEDRDRFNGVKVIQVPLQEALKNAERIFEKIER